MFERPVGPAFLLGFERMMDAIKHGEKLLEVLLSFKKHSNRDMGEKMFSGALSCLVATHLRLREAGWVSNCKDPGLHQFINGSKARLSSDLELSLRSSGAKNILQCFDQLFVLCSAVSQTKQYANFPIKRGGEGTAVQPMAVRVVAMPERITEMTVERDDNMEIKSTTQRQFDAPALSQ